jgi:hypothetical protein
MRTLLEAYMSRGWSLIPIPRGAKGPLMRGWQNFRLKRNDIPYYFREPTNVGVLLGEPSGGLTDVDLDCPEAVELAPAFLPYASTFGRASKRRSHWLYVTDAEKTLRLQVKGETFVELRSNGAQTVLPPSVHPSGELVEWGNEALETPRVDAKVLTKAVRQLATAVLFRRYSPAAEVEAWLAGGPYPSLPAEHIEDLHRLRGIEVIKPTRPARPPQEYAALEAAVDAYRRDHREEWPRSGGSCPICQHHGCFGRLSEERWSCFSASHYEGGLEGEKCWVGDVLDIHAYQQRTTRMRLLIDGGYLR